MDAVAMRTGYEEVGSPDVSGFVTEDDTPVDNFAQEKQQRLLTESLYSSGYAPPVAEDGCPRPFIAAANVGLYGTLKDDPLVPDVLLSLDVEIAKDWWAKRNRVYMVWEMGKLPDVVIEIVSNNEGDELGAKRRRYAKMKIPHYVVWDPQELLGDKMLHVFELRGDLLVPTESHFFASVGLGLVAWKGVFEGRHELWLRWRTADGRLLPTGAERADAAQSRADAAEAHAARLAAKLRDLGISLD